MKPIGYIIVGFEFGTVWADFFARHGVLTTGPQDIVRLILGFVVWGVLAFS